MDMEKIMWFLIGTFAGWLVIFIGIALGGAVLTFMFAALPVVLPVLGLIGLVWMIWYLLFNKK